MRLSATQRAVLEALVACGRPTAAISSTELAARTGINRSAVRAALQELRGKLDIAPGDDLVEEARVCGVLAAGAVAGVGRQVHDA